MKTRAADLRENTAAGGWKRGGRPAFTLIELMVVVAIIMILLALVAPSLRSAMDRARELRCANQMRQIGLVCLVIAQDSKSIMPAGNFWNPVTLTSNGGGRTIDRYMTAQGISSNIWYCPQLDDARAKPTEWMTSGAGKAPLTTNEFRIGYFYVGGMTHTNTTKFVANRPFDTRRMDGERAAMIFDFCATRDGIEPPNASDVPPGGWYTYPHLNRANPRAQNRLMTDFSLEKRLKDEIRIGYRYGLFMERVYW